MIIHDNSKMHLNFLAETLAQNRWIIRKGQLEKAQKVEPKEKPKIEFYGAAECGSAHRIRSALLKVTFVSNSTLRDKLIREKGRYLFLLLVTCESRGRSSCLSRWPTARRNTPGSWTAAPRRWRLCWRGDLVPFLGCWTSPGRRCCLSSCPPPWVSLPEWVWSLWAMDTQQVLGRHQTTAERKSKGLETLTHSWNGI